MTQVHPGINFVLQYIRNTSEYIPKLQLHQHSLLTRKVFSRHKLSAQVLFSISYGSSSSSLHLQVIFIWIITRFGSSSLDLDHHWIWIISTGSTSLDQDHHSIWINTTGSSLLVLSHDSSHTGISTEPSLFHAGCRPSLHVGLHR